MRRIIWGTLVAIGSNIFCISVLIGMGKGMYYLLAVNLVVVGSLLNTLRKIV